MNTERIISPKVNFLGELPYTNSKLISQNILSITTNKSIDTFVGTGEIEIVPDMQWAHELNAAHQDNNGYRMLDSIYTYANTMDIIDVTIEDVNENNPDYLMKGCIDQIIRTKHQMNNSTRRGITIRFSDLLSKLLAKDEIAFLAPVIDDMRIKNTFSQERLNFLAGGAGKAYKDNQNIFAGGTIEDAIRYILKNMQGTRVVIQTSLGERDVTDDIMSSTTISVDELDRIWRIDLNQFQGTIYEMIMNVLDQQFYEMWVDTVSDKSTMFLRKKPFEKESWDKLLTHTIRDEDIIDDTTGISDYEVKSVFRCFNNLELFGSQGSFAGRYGYNYPLVNLDAVKRYGLRQHNGQSTVINTRDMIQRGIDPDEPTQSCDEIDFLSSTIIRKRNMLYRWYGYPYFETGQIRIRGRQNIRVGNRIYLPDKIPKSGLKAGMLYYVAGVSQRYSIFNPFMTSLSLIRGQDAEGKDVEGYFSKILSSGQLVGEKMILSENDYAAENKQFYKSDNLA